VFDTPDALGCDLAAAILVALAGRRFVLGCPSGRSLRSTYAALGKAAARAGADLSGLVIAMMDEYVRPTGTGFAPCPSDAHYSCRGFARDEIRAVLNRGVPADRGVPEENIWIPNPGRPADFDARLEEAGGVDLFLLASGTSDGHVAFNGPGSARDSRTRVVALPETTRRDNLATFPAFATLDQVPRHGVTVGLGTIAEFSRKVVLVMHGRGKNGAARRLLSSTRFTPDWPTTIVFACADARVMLDRAAAGPCVPAAP
jgi:glucosamine-6-phosphate deaminase